MKKILLILLVLICAAAGGGYYLYGKATYRPAWYAAGAGLPRLETDVSGLEKKIIRNLKRGRKVRIQADQLVALAASRIESETGFRMEKAVKALRSTVTPSGIEVEMIVDALQLPVDRLPAKARKSFKRVIKSLPVGALEELYVKSHLRPVKGKDGISLDASSGLSLGKINFPLEKLEKALGRKAAIPLDRFPVGGFSLTDGALLLKPKTRR